MVSKWNMMLSQNNFYSFREKLRSFINMRIKYLKSQVKNTHERGINMLIFHRIHVDITVFSHTFNWIHGLKLVEFMVLVKLSTFPQIFPHIMNVFTIVALDTMLQDHVCYANIYKSHQMWHGTISFMASSVRVQL